jgi:hypothetical protein
LPEALRAVRAFVALRVEAGAFLAAFFAVFVLGEEAALVFVALRAGALSAPTARFANGFGRADLPPTARFFDDVA